MYNLCKGMKNSAYRNKNCLKHLLTWKKLPTFAKHKGNGGLAQLARALAWHARGHRFEPDILHCDRLGRFVLKTSLPLLYTRD